MSLREFVYNDGKEKLKYSINKAGRTECFGGKINGK